MGWGAFSHGHGHSGNQSPFIVFHFSWNPLLSAGWWMGKTMEQCFSHLNVHTNHLAILKKMQIWIL